MRVLVALLAVLLTGACSGGPGEDESRDAVQQARGRTDGAVREVAGVLQRSGYAVPGATGEHRVCGGLATDTPGVEYRAAVQVGEGGSGSVAVQVRRVSAALQESGWSPDSGGSDPQPHANLTRDDVRVNLTASRRQSGSLAVEVVHSCVEASEEVVDGLLGEQYRILPADEEGGE